jgi:hypothetical protein
MERRIATKGKGEMGMKEPRLGYIESRKAKRDDNGLIIRKGKRIDSDERKARWEELKAITWPRIVEYVKRVQPSQKGRK